MNQKIEELRKKVEEVKAMVPSGMTSDEQFDRYFKSYNELVEGVLQEVAEVKDATTTEIESVKDAVKSFRDVLKKNECNMQTLGTKEIQYQMGKALAACWNNDMNTLGSLKCCPNLKNENWNNPKDFKWDSQKGFTAAKEVLGTPMGNMATNDQYLINPIYEDSIMTDVGKKSVMMNLVTTIPMAGPSMYIPERDRGGVQLNWLTQTGQKITGSKPNGATRKELKAYTLAGYIPFYDEFDEDSFVDLGKLFMEEFSDSYAEEFDRQCLIADESPFTGAIKTANAEQFAIASTDASKLTYLDFRNAELKVRPEERKNCRWFFHETVLNHIANILDANGDPIWRKPGDGIPGRIDGYEYHESSLLPQISELSEGMPFAIFMNPKRIIHGNRRGIEIKRFTDTTESLEYGELFMRFRKRSGFLLTRPVKNMVIMNCASE